MDKLKESDYFHDWNINALAVRDRHKLIVMLEYDGKHATATFREGLHNPLPAHRAVCCPRCSGGEDAGTSITVLFEP
ncbi:hypothetical protein [Paraburkholderia antibiotica]|uniref:Uncharacterized protein n=1 Tax=Paraburkholderia antibiotica TaxID=2728839 RepID=A0A7X9X4C5_9BURK|nr:hypothetical protein [Paraburkholderia antibiotica]NML30994.1 hypothetical protein [Paraburkholderia antibiotica]